MVEKAYEKLLERSREISALESVARLLHWDQQTYMPEKGQESRSQQRALLARLIHERTASPELRRLLEEIEGSGRLESLGPEARANVRELRREHDRQFKVPAALVEEIEKTAALSYRVWVEAKGNDDFDSFAPRLEEIVRLSKAWADAVGYQHERYDALLDTYEPGMRAAEIEPLFESLRSELVPLVRRIVGARCEVDTSMLRRKFDAATLRRFGKGIARDLGFDFKAGRLDASAHPFCCGVSITDVRITTSAEWSNPIDALFAVIHEVGHGLYHQGLLPRHRGTPMGSAVSLGVHESQSRWWENFIGRSRSFWEHYFPKLQEAFPGLMDDVAPDRFYGAINAVRPSPIRVEADEVTYNLHVLLRFELERDLLSDRLDVRDLPEAWNGKMEHYLGIRPAASGEGVLQDVHWAHGMFGYFPTYTLGNLYAAQLDRRIRREIPDLDAMVGRGEFHELLAWIREKIHRHGSRYRPAELVRRATGEALSTTPLVDYLQGKFGPPYGG
jgi:carboxypeptidase Taq